MREGEGNIIFIATKRAISEHLLTNYYLQKLFDRFEINKQHLSCSECFN